MACSGHRKASNSDGKFLVASFVDAFGPITVYDTIIKFFKVRIFISPYFTLVRTIIIYTGRKQDTSCSVVAYRSVYC